MVVASGHGVSGHGASEELQAAAAADFKRHTLASFDTQLACVVYVASLRDYNTGRYYHDGLAALYGPAAAEMALASCHDALFQQVVRMSAAELVSDLIGFIEQTDGSRNEILQSWQTLKAYQTLIPLRSDSVSTQLFMSNMNIAVMILRLREIRKSAMPGQSPDSGAKVDEVSPG